jgi:hypothetical protein
MDEAPENVPASTALIEGLCTICRRTAYVRDGSEMACPVCSSPLLSIAPAAEAETEAI